MAKINELKGFCYPLSPEGKCSLLGNPPWHYGTEYLNILYRVDPDAVKKWLPEPVTLGENPDLAYVAFSKWWSVWDDNKDLAWINPERTQYMEAAIWVGCSYKSEQFQMCLPIWVDNDFTMARGWAMGFPKKFGKVSITDYNPYNPGMPKMGVGAKVSGTVASHGERLIKGTLSIEEQVSPSDIPSIMRRPLVHLRHFPSITEIGKPSVCELVSLGSINRKADPVVWKGSAELEFFASELEEHMPLAPKEVLGGYKFRNGYTFDKGTLLHDYLAEKE